jgi:uncharacterized protein YbjT (DUF2867 family)
LSPAPSCSSMGEGRKSDEKRPLSESIRSLGKVPMTSVLLLGGSGLVGRVTLESALNDRRVGRVVAPTRRSLPPHPKLVNHISPSLESFLPDVTDWAIDSVICALGTTQKKAGSRKEFRHVDYELPLAFVRRAQESGATAFAVITSIGASPSSRLFYARTKGELERDLQRLGLQSLTIVRPMFINDDRPDFRLGEAAVVFFAKALAPILPKGLRVSRASTIAHVLVDAVVEPRPGRRVISSRELASASKR